MTDTTELTRRTVLAAGAAVAISGAASPGTAVPLTARQNRLWYSRPASNWNEASPVGNGRLGAMVFGRVGQERLQLNENTLWSGAPYTPDNPDAKSALPQVRALLAAGKYKAAEELASEQMIAKPLSQMAYGTLGDVLLTFPEARQPHRYVRELDIADAIATVAFNQAALNIRRECFASAPDQVIVLRLEADAPDIEFQLAYRGPRKADFVMPSYTGPATPSRAGDITKWLAREDSGLQSPGCAVIADGHNAILITGHNEPGPGIPAGLTFAIRIVAIADGEVVASEAGLQVSKARSVTLLIAAATSFVNYRDVSGDPVAKVKATSAAAAAKPFAALRADHVADHRALFDRVSIDLGGSPAAADATADRIAGAETRDDPSLAALYFQFARYLLISSSRPGGQPANLQGLWNAGTNPPWGSKYTININTEMNYWFADAAALGECVSPLLRMVEELAVTGAATARTMYGARGWVAHHNTDLWRAAAPIDGPFAGLWPCGGAWLCNTLWLHWDYARDPGELRRLYPLLEGASLFFLDTLIEDPAGRGLITSPSISPENNHPFGSALCAGPAMDRQIIRDLFAYTIAAGEKLGSNSGLREQLGEARRRIAPDKIGASGQLQEWLEDWDAQAPDLHHRHVSHLYAVYPSGQINVRDTPALVEAAKVSLRQRGDFTTGWGTAWRACLWARMGEGDHAHAILNGLLGPQRTYPNMFDAHPPFQIDGNFGGTAAIQEMLVQSWGGELRLLPALPRAWPAGHINGLRARAGFTVNLSWRDGRCKLLELRGAPGSQVRVYAGGDVFQATLNSAGHFRKNWT